MSAIDTRSLLEAGASGVLFAGADFAMSNQAQFNLTTSGKEAGQQFGLTLAAPVARQALNGAGVSMPVSADLMDAMLTGMMTMGADKLRGKQTDFKRMLYSGGAAFVARKGRDLMSGENILTGAAAF